MRAGAADPDSRSSAQGFAGVWLSVYCEDEKEGLALTRAISPSLTRNQLYLRSCLARDNHCVERLAVQARFAKRSQDRCLRGAMNTPGHRDQHNDGPDALHFPTTPFSSFDPL